jgi:hypothetical protein
MIDDHYRPPSDMGDRVALWLGIVALGVDLGAMVWLALQLLW